MKKIIISLFLIFSLTMSIFSVIAEKNEQTDAYSDEYSFIDPVIADGKEFFVSSENGKIGNSGSIDSPFSKLSEALNVVEPGDTIYLRAGTYNEKNYIGKRGNRKAWFVIKPYNGEKVVFDNDFGSEDSCIVFNASAGYWHVEGFEIKNYTGAGIWIKGGKNYRIENMTIHDISNPAFSNYGTEAILAGGTNILISGCYLYDIGTFRLSSLDHGIYATSGRDWVIENNIIRNAPGGGIQQYAGYTKKAQATGFNIKNNVFIENLYQLVLSSCENTEVSGNVFINAKETDFNLMNYVKNSKIENNYFYNSYFRSSKYKKGSWSSYSIKDNSVKCFFMFSEDSENITGNKMNNNFFCYEQLDFKIKYGGENREIGSPAKICEYDETNSYQDNMYLKTGLSNPNRLCNYFALANNILNRL